MNQTSTPLSQIPTIKLGVRGLPELSANMLGGGIYALEAKMPSARFPILAGCLESALARGVTCSVVVPSKPEAFVQRIEAFGNINVAGLSKAGKFNILVAQSEFQKKMFRFGPAQFVRELERFEIPSNSFLVFDQADDLLALHDISLALEQAEVLGKWFEQQQVTGLLVFSRVTEEHSRAMDAIMDSLTGIACLGAGRDGLELTSKYWRSPEGTIAAHNYCLRALPSGLYEAYERAEPTVQAVVVNSDGSSPEVRHEVRTEVIHVPAPAPEVEPEPEFDEEPCYFYLDKELDALGEMTTGQWQHVQSPIEMMQAALSHRSATSILNFERDTDVRQLAATVHALRVGSGRGAHIVVREKDASLRYQNEALLLRLGVSLVIHRDVAIGRYPLLLQSLQGRVYSKVLDVTFESALASVSPTELRGYVVPKRFVPEARQIVERAQMLDIPNVLFLGKLPLGRSMTDVLVRVKLARGGDLITCDGERCLVFLNACTAHDADETLEKVFGQSVAAIFSDSRVVLDRAEIASHINALELADQTRQMPDYSYMMVEPDIDSAEHNEHSVQEGLIGSGVREPYDSASFRYSDALHANVFGKRIVPRALRSVRST